MMLRHSNHTVPEEDSVLLSRYAESGDLSVLATLFTKHSEMLYYVCLRYFKDEERSKDAVMQIFEELITKVHKQEIKNFGKWLYVVAKNHCLMALRRQKNTQELSSDEFVEFPLDVHPLVAPTEDSHLVKEKHLQQMERCLEQLPEKQRTSIDLFFLKEKCYQEVANVTGYSMKEVKSYIQNGKRNLKNCMEKSHGEGV